MAQTKADRNAYMNTYMKARYHRRRSEAVAAKGGKCIDCGTASSLEFDHDDAASKSYDIGKLFSTASEQKLQDELAKCVLRCTDCHKIKTEISGDQGSVGHGEGKTGKRNCLCDLCRPLKNEYNKQFKRNKKLGSIV